MLLFSRSVMCDSLWCHGLQHTRLPCPSSSHGACSNSCPLSWWCHPIISSSVVHLSSGPQFFPALGSFLMSWLFISGGQSTGASTSTSVLPVNIREWFPLGWTGGISLQSKIPSRVFSNTIVQKHQFFSTQLYSPIVQLAHPYLTTGKTIVLTIIIYLPAFYICLGLRWPWLSSIIRIKDTSPGGPVLFWEPWLQLVSELRKVIQLSISFLGLLIIIPSPCAFVRIKTI